MPVIPVLIPVAATPMAGLFWPFLTRKKSLSAEISCRPENIRRLFVIIAPGFEQPILQNVIGRLIRQNNLNPNYGRLASSERAAQAPQQPQSQLWAALQALKGRNISAQVVRPGYCRVSTIIRPARSAHCRIVLLK